MVPPPTMPPPPPAPPPVPDYSYCCYPPEVESSNNFISLGLVDFNLILSNFFQNPNSSWLVRVLIIFFLLASSYSYGFKLSIYYLSIYWPPYIPIALPNYKFILPRQIALLLRFPSTTLLEPPPSPGFFWRVTLAF